MSKSSESLKAHPRSRTARCSRIHPAIRFLSSALALIFGISIVAHAQISPGPLARAHQNLSGGSNCIKCHEVSTSTPTFRCLECHEEIAAELQQDKGLHATFPRSGPPGAACVKCHSDHNGENFQMIHWDPTPKGFDHSKTGYLLDGKHRRRQLPRLPFNATHRSAAARSAI